MGNINSYLHPHVWMVEGQEGETDTSFSISQVLRVVEKSKVAESSSGIKLQPSCENVNIVSAAATGVFREAFLTSEWILIVLFPLSTQVGPFSAALHCLFSCWLPKKSIWILYLV